MNLSKALYERNFYRFTGTPENWLTAIKYMTWGFTPDLTKRWEKLQVGDVFFMHSTGNSPYFNNARSAIIGMGVIGSNFTIKDNFLWIEEQLQKKNIWQLLVPFSEIYMFSDIPDKSLWESPSVSNLAEIKILIDKMLKSSIPLSAINSFPQMGSFSSVQPEVAMKIIDLATNLKVMSEPDNLYNTRRNVLLPISEATEVLRTAGSLQIFEEVKKKAINPNTSIFERDNELLARAEDAHGGTLQDLINFFRERNYETYSNPYVDLFAIKDEKSFLCEVKSIENKNFRSQARKGIAQLLEYEYFEISKFREEKGIENLKNNNILVSSRRPNDQSYINFINYLDMDIGVMESSSLISVGKDISISSI